MSAELIPAAQVDATIARAVDSCLTGIAINTRKAYARSIRLFLAYAQTSGAGLTREGVNLWLRTQENAGQKSVSLNQSIAAIKRLANEASANGWLSYEIAAQIGTIKTRKVLGVRSGNWLNSVEAKDLVSAPDRSTLKGRRDAAVLSLLVGTGIRRSEAVGLQCAQVVYRDKDGQRVMYLENLVGKGGRIRSVQVPDWAASDVAAWLLDLEKWVAFGMKGPVLRRIRAAGTIGGGLSACAVRMIVLHYCRRLKLGEIAPHDLRRTHAKLARDGGAPLEVVQKSLGHASIQTTERYLGAGEQANAGDYMHLDVSNTNRQPIDTPPREFDDALDWRNE
jgi:site-specific recombinase XerD